MSTIPLHEQIAAAVAAVRQYTQLVPKVALILGSGLGDLVEAVEGPVEVPYSAVPNVCQSTVLGHVGKFVLGHLAGRPVVVMQGRLHYYEGYSLVQTTFPLRVMRGLGAEVLIVTNASGGLNPSFHVGDIMRIVDQLNFLGMAGQSPLYGPNDPEVGPRFVEMQDAYDPRLGALADEVASALGLELRHGVYAQLSGPTFESPAEVKMLRVLGADATGMSTAAEVVVARHGGMKVLGFSLVTNVAGAETALEPGADPHHAVLAAGKRAIPRLVAMIKGVLERM
jgi:purine-nucleoside phosphorylase